MEILLDNRRSGIEIDLHGFRRKTERLLEDLGCDPSTELSVSLVGSEEMADLNARFRGVEGPTNVLSFSQLEGDRVGGDAPVLGDVVICLDRALTDAEELGYDLDDMVLYLLVHGVLHLMGHEHDNPADADAMAARVESLFHDLTGEDEGPSESG